jgi:hypothetical protein
MVHHLQDMTTPSHVVPVMHWLNDGFEKYRLNGDISSGLSCADLVGEPDIDPNDLLVNAAKETLNSVSHLHVKIIADKRAISVDGDAFWIPSTDNSFGEYGILGNHYGEISFTQNEIEYTVPDNFYDSFKNNQMKLGTKVTLEALYWFLILH